MIAASKQAFKRTEMDAEKFAKLEQEVLDSERRGTVLSNNAYISIAGRAGNEERPEVDALLKRAQAVRERDGLFFRDMEGTIAALENGQLSLSSPQMLALSVQATCNYHIVHDSTKLGYGRDAIAEYQNAIGKAKSLYTRAVHLFSDAMARERARKKAHEDSPSSNSCAAHLSSRSAPDNDGL
jgi:hypothetical protein